MSREASDCPFLEAKDGGGAKLGYSGGAAGS